VAPLAAGLLGGVYRSAGALRLWALRPSDLGDPVTVPVTVILLRWTEPCRGCRWRLRVRADGAVLLNSGCTFFGRLRAPDAEAVIDPSILQLGAELRRSGAPSDRLTRKFYRFTRPSRVTF